MSVLSKREKEQIKETKKLATPYVMIPTEILEDSEIDPVTLKVFCYICVLCWNEEQKCFATNSYFADKMNCSSRTISNCITTLEKRGYIISQLIDKEHVGTRRYITLTEMYYATVHRKKMQAGGMQ